MKTPEQTYHVTIYCTVDIEATSPEEAIEIAMAADFNDFVWDAEAETEV